MSADCDELRQKTSAQSHLPLAALFSRPFCLQPAGKQASERASEPLACHSYCPKPSVVARGTMRHRRGPRERERERAVSLLPQLSRGRFSLNSRARLRLLIAKWLKLANCGPNVSEEANESVFRALPARLLPFACSKPTDGQLRAPLAIEFMLPPPPQLACLLFAYARVRLLASEATEHSLLERPKGSQSAWRIYNFAPLNWRICLPIFWLAKQLVCRWHQCRARPKARGASARAASCSR